jgi:hypothetical protein
VLLGCEQRWLFIDGQHVVKRFFIFPAPTPDLVADAENPAQYVSRRSILPTGNLATLCRPAAYFAARSAQPKLKDIT